jgi:hypothetical protein
LICLSSDLSFSGTCFACVSSAVHHFPEIELIPPRRKLACWLETELALVKCEVVTEGLSKWATKWGAGIFWARLRSQAWSLPPGTLR